MKQKKANADIMVTLTVTAIIAIIAISIVVGLITNQTSTTAVTDDLFTGDNGVCVRVTGECLISTSLSIKNGSQTAGAGNYTSCPTDQFDHYGVQLTDAEFDATALNATYSERSCEYIAGTTGTIIGYVPLLMAVGLLVFVAFFIKT